MLNNYSTQIQKGSSSARADDTKGLKGVILDWITPPGEALRPPLSRNVKTDRGFFHDTTGRLLCPIGFDWDDPAYASHPHFQQKRGLNMSLYKILRTKEGLRTGTISVSGDQWPLFLYKDNAFDPENVWKGLFRSSLLVFVESLAFVIICAIINIPEYSIGIQTHFHLA
jgi:hypothetical protein